MFKMLTRDTKNLRLVSFVNATWLTDDLLKPVVEVNLLLERVDLSGCTSLSDASLQRVSVCLTRLTHLCLSQCSWVSGSSIEYLAFHHSKREATRSAIGEEEKSLKEGRRRSYTEMSLMDSLQIINHSGLRTKLIEKKKSR